MHAFRSLLALLVVAATIGLLEATLLDECSGSYDGLLDRIKPDHYYVTMEICTKNFVYNATAAIRFKVSESDAGQEPKNVIILHADDNLDINTEDLVVKYQGKNYWKDAQLHTIGVASLCRVSSKQLFVIVLGEDLQPGTVATVYLTLESRIYGSGSGKGLWKHEGNNQLKSVIGAHLKETSARSIFPCFDHDKFKSSFYLEMLHDAKLKVSSSTALIYERFMRTRTRKLMSSVITSFYPISLGEVSFDVHPI